MRLRKKLLIVTGVFLVLIAVSLKPFLRSIYRLPILMYHHIDYSADRKDKRFVTPEAFEKQMKFLREKNYNVITLEEAVKYIKKKEIPPAKTVAITIDDGYKDNYDHAYPVLKKYNIPAAIFVIVDKIGTEGFMNWKEVKELSDLKLVDIESHTLHHDWLPGLNDKRLEEEMVESKGILEKKLGRPVRYIAYPLGIYDERVKSAAKKAGYEAAFATKPTRRISNYDPFEIKRLRISPDRKNPFVFRAKVSGYYSFLRIAQQDYKDIPQVIWEKRY